MILRGYFINVTYEAYTKNAEEAYYLAAILNSSAPNLLMEDFQAKGLLGAGGVEKKILDIYFPAFDAGKALHLDSAACSKEVHEKRRSL